MSEQLPVSTRATLTYIPWRWDLAKAEAARATLLEKGGRDDSRRLREEGAAEAKIALAAAHEAGIAELDRIIEEIGARLDACEQRPPTFYLRVPTIRQEYEFDAELTRWASNIITNDVFYEAIAEAVRLGEPANQEFLLELLEEAQSDQASMPADRQRALLRLERRVAAAAPEVAEMVAARQKWLRLMPVCAFRHFVSGWAHLDPPYRRDPWGLVDMAVIDALPLDLINEVGGYAWSLRKVSRDQEKNFESRPRKAEARPHSEVPVPPTADGDGTSTASGMSETPPSG